MFETLSQRGQLHVNSDMLMLVVECVKCLYVFGTCPNAGEKRVVNRVSCLSEIGIARAISSKSKLQGTLQAACCASSMRESPKASGTFWALFFYRRMQPSHAFIIRLDRSQERAHNINTTELCYGITLLCHLLS